MKKMYTVDLPIIGYASVEVPAESHDEAIVKALDIKFADVVELIGQATLDTTKCIQHVAEVTSIRDLTEEEKLNEQE